MRIDVVSIFPDYLAPLHLSLVGKAIGAGIVDLAVHDLRDWTHDRHRTVDDTPYGGGAGMVMRPEPWGEALDDLAPADGGPQPTLIVLTPAGTRFTQRMAEQLSHASRLIFACGRYEGIDARVTEYAQTRMPVEEVSIGDYVLNGGEAAALVMIEAVVRLLPGVLGNPASLEEESHSTSHGGLLEYPLYTKPARWRGLAVPDVLLSGHHAQVAGWRHDQALAKTTERRPDLLSPDPVGVTISHASEADAGELLTLQRAAFVAEGRVNGSLDIPPLTESLEGVVKALQRETVLVVRRGGRLLGSVRGARSAEGHWFIGRLVVVPDQQGRGIGRRLMDEIEALRPAGAERCRLVTGLSSVGNIAFYGRHGYVEVARDVDDVGVPIIVMEKVFTPEE